MVGILEAVIIASKVQGSLVLGVTSFTLRGAREKRLVGKKGRNVQ